MADENSKLQAEQPLGELSEEALASVSGGYTAPSRSGDWCYNLETNTWEFRDRKTGRILKTSRTKPW